MFQTGVCTFNQSGSSKNETATSSAGTAPVDNGFNGGKNKGSDFMLDVQLLQHALPAVNIKFKKSGI